MATLDTSVGLRISASADVETVRDMISKLLNHGVIQTNAGSVANTLAASRLLDPTPPVISACSRLLNRKQN